MVATIDNELERRRLVPTIPKTLVGTMEVASKWLELVIEREQSWLEFEPYPSKFSRLRGKIGLQCHERTRREEPLGLLNALVRIANALFEIAA